MPDVSKIEILGAQDEQIFLEFSTQRLAALGLDYPALIATLQAQNAVRPAGVLQTGDERISLRVSGAFDSELDLLDVNFVAGDRIVRLGDIAEVRRGYADPPQPMFRVNGKPAIGLAIAMRDGGDILALGRNISHAMAEIQAELPIGIEPTLVADQAVTVDLAINEFTTSLVAGDPDHHRGELRQPRRPPRHGGRAVDPADARDRLPDHGSRSTSTCSASRSAP